MNKIPVVFTFDKRIILGAAVAIKSLIDCAKPETIYDIYVYHPDIDEKTIKEFEKITQDTNHTITFEYIAKERFKNAPINKGGSWTEIVYYRLLIPELLPQYDKVIYSDVDVLFKDDLSELYESDISGYELAAVRAEKNTPNAIGHKYFKENKKEYIFWSGLLLINCDQFRKEKIQDKLQDNLIKHFSELKFFDLDLINITCQNILPLDFKYCVLQGISYVDKFETSSVYKYLKDVYSYEELSEAKKHPAIIHYAGTPGKPWRRKYIPEDYKEYMNKIPKSLKKFTFRDLRKRLFSKV